MKYVVIKAAGPKAWLEKASCCYCFLSIPGTCSVLVNKCPIVLRCNSVLMKDARPPNSYQPLSQLEGPWLGLGPHLMWIVFLQRATRGQSEVQARQQNCWEKVRYVPKMTYTPHSDTCCLIPCTDGLSSCSLKVLLLPPRPDLAATTVDSAERVKNLGRTLDWRGDAKGVIFYCFQCLNSSVPSNSSDSSQASLCPFLPLSIERSCPWSRVSQGVTCCRVRDRETDGEEEPADAQNYLRFIYILMTQAPPLSGDQAECLATGPSALSTRAPQHHLSFSLLPFRPVHEVHFYLILS